MAVRIIAAEVLPTELDIAAFEAATGILLPAEYCTFLLTYGDGSPGSNKHPTDRRGVWIERFLSSISFDIEFAARCPNFRIRLL